VGVGRRVQQGGAGRGAEMQTQYNRRAATYAYPTQHTTGEGSEVRLGTRAAVCAATAAAGVCLAYAIRASTPAQLLEDAVAAKYRSLRSLRHTLRATFEALVGEQDSAAETVSRGDVARAVSERPFVRSQLRALGVGNLVTLEVLERDAAGRVDLWELLAHFELEVQLLEIFERCDEADTGAVRISAVRDYMLGACRREPQLLVILSSIMDSGEDPVTSTHQVGGRGRRAEGKYAALVGSISRACSPWAQAKAAAANRQCVNFFFELVGADGEQEVSLEEILEVFRATLSVKREMDEEDGKESVVGRLSARMMDAMPLSVRAPVSVDLQKTLRRETADGVGTRDLLQGLSRDSVRSAVARLRHTGGKSIAPLVNSKACQDIVLALSSLAARPEVAGVHARFRSALKSPALSKLRWTART